MRQSLGAALLLASLQARFWHSQPASAIRQPASNYQWSISGYDGTQNKFMIAPGATVDIPYANATAVVISGYVPNRTYTKQFQLQAGSGGCFTIPIQRQPWLCRY